MAVSEMHRAILGDFEVAWTALAEHGSGGGNFMFAHQAMTLLEWASRLCASDATGEALRVLSKELRARDKHYFTELPSACGASREFDLPHDPAVEKDRHLLAMLFDVVRHGMAHQYQQITVELKGGFGAVPITGTARGYTLDQAEQNRPMHLGHGRETFEEDRAPIHYVILCPELLFLDLKGAIEQARLTTRGLSFDYLRRGGSVKKLSPGLKRRAPQYDFTVDELATALDEAAHTRVRIET
jgi:hypothetical protein